jgi:pimeloyl-ACP methyl ester carboxylesterase
MNATDTANLVPYGNGTLPAGIRSRVVNNNNGLMVHVLEAGFETAGRPCALLLHGFPELAYSWRKVMLPLAKAGYHVVAPDQRGYGRTTGWDGSYDADGDPFRNVKWDSSTRSATARWRASSATTRARRWRRGAR